MRNESFFRLALVIGALHVVMLSFVFGLRHMGYILTAALSGALIWCVVFLLSGRKRPAGVAAGLAVGLAVQQAAYQTWKAELTGCWWPLAQFVALHILVACGMRRMAR